MRIAYLLGLFPTMSETFVGNEIRALEAMGHEIFPIALHRPQGAFQPLDQSLMERCHYFSAISEAESKRLIRKFMWRLPALLPFLMRQSSEPRKDMLTRAADIAERVIAHQCTHIHAHFAWGATTYAIAAAKLANVPVSFTCHGSDVYANPIDLSLKCRSADAVIAVAPTITGDVQKLAPRTPCHTVYCGIDPERYAPLQQDLRKHERWLFVGRLIDCKGVEDLVAAWALLPEAERPELDIVGDGELKEALKQQCSHLKLDRSIRFLGEQSSDWIAQHGPTYHAFVAPFKLGKDKKRDTAPLVLKEAMAMELPIVTTDFIDIPSVVGPDCAMICPPGDASSLADAIRMLQQKDAPSLQQMGKAGRAKVIRDYTLAQQAQHLNDIFQALA